MARMRGKVTIAREACKGCSLCVVSCPLGLLALEEDFNRKGYHPAGLASSDRCTGCALCALMCPETCVTVERLEEEKA